MEGKTLLRSRLGNREMLSRKLSNRKIIVDVFSIMFGIGAWIGINGIYVQLPLLINSAPERWTLPAYMVMLVQIANLGPILYTLYSKYLAWAHDRYIIYALLGAGAVSIFLLAFNYNKTSYILGAEHSTSLLGLMFVTAVIGCTSSVLFMPYLRNYREIYLLTYLIGEGLSGFIPSVAALVQGVGGNPECVNVTKPDSTKWEFTTYFPPPRFSPEIFFLFVGTILFLSFVSFIGLTWLPVAIGERVKTVESDDAVPTDTRAPPSYQTSDEWKLSKSSYTTLLLVMTFICFLGHSTLPSIQSYSCLPYGNLVYHFTLTLSAMANPLAMSLGFVYKSPRVSHLVNLTGLIAVLSIFVFYLALQSPSPPLQDHWLGKLLVVVSWVALSGLIGFIKMGVTTLFRSHPGRGLYHIGIATQIGSFVGAIMIFYLVNYTKLFVSYSPCTALMGQ